MSVKQQPNAEIKTEDDRFIINSKVNSEFKTSEGSSLKEAVDNNDNLTVDTGKDIVVEDTNNNFGLGSTLEESMVRYLMNSMNIDKEDAICKVLKPKVKEVYNDNTVEIVLEPNHRTYGDNEKEALVEYYNEQII